MAGIVRESTVAEVIRHGAVIADPASIADVLRDDPTLYVTWMVAEPVFGVLGSDEGAFQAMASTHPLRAWAAAHVPDVDANAVAGLALEYNRVPSKRLVDDTLRNRFWRAQKLWSLRDRAIKELGRDVVLSSCDAAPRVAAFLKSSAFNATVTAHCARFRCDADGENCPGAPGSFAYFPRDDVRRIRAFSRSLDTFVASRAAAPETPWAELWEDATDWQFEAGIAALRRWAKRRADEDAEAETAAKAARTTAEADDTRDRRSVSPEAN